VSDWFCSSKVNGFFGTKTDFGHWTLDFLEGIGLWTFFWTLDMLYTRAHAEEE